MKLLIITQVVDKKDTVLGFFLEWIKELSTKFESIVVICLKEGEHDLPSNVRVLSLGKEKGVSKVKYVFNFYKYIWNERKNYDAVFVHMNQEYVLLGWKLWKLLGKKIYMWRNHHEGNLFTDIAALFCSKVFCTSKFSYTAKYKKTVLMPIGVDTDKFTDKGSEVRKKNSILFLARMAPVKKPDLLVDALGDLKEKEIEFSASFYGDPLSKDQGYYDGLRKRAESSSSISFFNGVPNTETPAIYQSHSIFVNLSSSGMYDKTIIEAMSCGCLVLASNENLRGEVDDMFIFKEGDREELGKKMSALLLLSEDEVSSVRKVLRAFALKHSLSTLSDKLVNEIK
ncbi:MAG: glycosyltransferase family 4 protein [Candidatus Paceibacterota bacterium]|jgi:glycosyltransferase involved in cell wall biosynthesis